jgi:hypothetical protein
MAMRILKRESKNISLLSMILVIMCASAFSINVIAAGTLAGTVIKNRASIAYSIANDTFTAQSPEAMITVQELVKVLIQSQDAGSSVLVPIGQASAALLFQVTNSGNGEESFTLTQSDLTGDDFDISTNFDQIYIDTDSSDGTFNSIVDTVYDNASPPALAPDEFVSIWAVSLNFPTNLTADNRADIQIRALPVSFEGAPNIPVLGDIISNVGGLGIDAIYGSTVDSSLETGSFIIDNPVIDVTITQQILSILDTDGGTIIRAGSEVAYQLTVNIEGAGGNASNIVVNNPLPPELALKNGSSGIITIVGSGDYTAEIGDDLAEYNTTTNTIIVTLPDMTVVTPAVQTFIKFTTSIQ